MKSSLFLLIIYLSIIFLVSTFGGLLPLIRKRSKNFIRLIISFGAGVLFGACFFHMLPETILPLGKDIGIPIMIGFFIIYILEKFVMVHTCEEEICDFHTIGMSAFLGISIHSLLEGLSMGAGFIMQDIGFMVFLAIVVHKFPSALSLTGILIQGDYKKNKIIQLILILALATPAGALISYFVLKEMNELILAWAIGISSGTFLYIATSDLLPLVHQHNPRKYFNLLSLVIGLFFMWCGKFFLS